MKLQPLMHPQLLTTTLKMYNLEENKALKITAGNITFRGGSNPILPGHPLEISGNFAINKSFSSLITLKRIQNVDQL